MATIILILLWVAYPSKTTDSVKLSEPVSVVEVKAVPEVPVILKKIAWCESQNRQFDEDGNVHRGIINPKDTGKYQVNEYYHLENSKKLGIDIYTLEGNTEYALYLYRRNGIRDWDWSKGCWGDPERVWWEKDGNYWSTNKKK